MLIFICLVSRTSTRFYFIFHAVLKVFWISVSVEYTPLEKSEQMSKTGFFLSRLHIGLDSGFSSKIGRIPQNWNDWTVCTWGLRLWAARGVWGHATIENVTKILTLWNAISSVQRGQFSSKMFAKLIAIFNLHYCLRGFTCKYSTYVKFCAV